MVGLGETPSQLYEFDQLVSAPGKMNYRVRGSAAGPAGNGRFHVQPKKAVRLIEHHPIEISQVWPKMLGIGSPGMTIALATKLFMPKMPSSVSV